MDEVSDQLVKIFCNGGRAKIRILAAFGAIGNTGCGSAVAADCVDGLSGFLVFTQMNAVYVVRIAATNVPAQTPPGQQRTNRNERLARRCPAAGLGTRRRHRTHRKERKERKKGP